MKLRESITPKLRDWIDAQHVFFVATAPHDADGHVNLSPRGGPGMAAVIDERTFAWLDLTGSGSETIAHLRENGRIVLRRVPGENRDARDHRRRRDAGQ